jgi:hypothetical protein
MGEVPRDETTNESGEHAETNHGVDRAEVKGGKEHRVDKRAEEVSTDHTANSNTDPGGLEHEPGSEESQQQSNSETDGKSNSGGHPSENGKDHQDEAEGEHKSNAGSHPGEPALTEESDNGAAKKHEDSENPGVIFNEAGHGEAVNGGTAGVVGDNNLEVAGVTGVVNRDDLGVTLSFNALVAANFSGELVVDYFARSVIFTPGVGLLSHGDAGGVAILGRLGLGRDDISVGILDEGAAGQSGLLAVGEGGHVGIFEAGELVGVFAEIPLRLAIDVVSVGLLEFAQVEDGQVRVEVAGKFGELVLVSDFFVLALHLRRAGGVGGGGGGSGTLCGDKSG